MNGLEKIVARMEADTRAECDALTASAAENAAAGAAAADPGTTGATVATTGSGHCAALDGDVVAAAALSTAAKQQLIDEAFAGAAQRLSSLPQAEYIDLLAALAAENGSGDEELLLSAKDREAVGPAVVKAANARKAGAAFRLSEETRETGGGLVLRRGRVELNCSFTEKLRQLRQEESSAVARLLFD